MKSDTLSARILPLAVLAAAVAAFVFVLVLAAMPSGASVGPRPSVVSSNLGAPSNAAPSGVLAEVKLGDGPQSPAFAGPPRCSLEVTQDRYENGETVRASLHLSNPMPASTEVEMKIWFSAPGEPPLSLADPLEEGRSLELPPMLNRDSGKLRLFSVDTSTPRGVYEMNCRLIDPITGETLSEDLNAFQVE